MSVLGDLRVVAVHRDFRKLFTVRLVSQSGDGMFQAGLATLFFFSPERLATASDVAVAFAVLGYPLFLLLNTGSVVAAIAAHCLLAAIESVYISAAVSAGVEMFATRVRFSGFSIGYNVCVAVFGGTTPYMVTWLTATTGNAIAPAYYLVTAAVISLAAVLTLRESAGRPLQQVGAGVETRLG